MLRHQTNCIIYSYSHTFLWLFLNTSKVSKLALSLSLQVELVYYVFGRHKFPGAITANLERCVRRFNEVQHWVVTELCLCEDLVKRAILLKKFIKIAAV